MTRIEQIQERAIAISERQQEQTEILINAAAEHKTRIARQEALIERLDAIIKRMIYREGRSGNDAQPQQ